MRKFINFLIKREQSRTGSGFAECEKSRLKAKLTMTLALLITAVGGAWAQTDEITVTPVSGQTNKWTFTMPASDVELQVEYYAESNLFLSKDALADKGSISVTAGDLGVQFGDDGKSANTVTEGTPMTVTYNGTKKLLGMKVEKKAPALLSIEIGGHVTATIYYFEGETWEQAIQNHPTENSAWKIDNGHISGNGPNLTAGGNYVNPNSTIDPKADYHLWWT